MGIQQIRSEAEYIAALAAVSKLVDVDPVNSPPASAELERLSILTERYEAEHFPIEISNPAGTLKPFSREKYLQQLREAKLEPHPVVDFGEPRSNEFGGLDEQS